MTENFYRGNDGISRIDAEARKLGLEENQNPLRFWLKAGHQAEVMVLDGSPAFFMWEHEFYNANAEHSRDIYERHFCTKETGHCPICERTGKESVYHLFLSVLDFSGYTKEDGTPVRWMRKLMAVKPEQQDAFMRVFQEQGTLRGAVFTMKRSGRKSASIGDDIEFDRMTSIPAGRYHHEWADEEGTVHEEDHGFVYDYEAIFPNPAVEPVRDPVRGTLVARNASDVEDGAWSEAEWDRGRSDASESGVNLFGSSN